MSKRYSWLKLLEGFFDSKYVKAIRRLPSGDTIIVIYLNLWTKCLKDNGYYYFEDVGDSIEEEIALFLNENVNMVKLTLEALKRFNLIEFNEDKSALLPTTKELMVGSEAESTSRSRECRLRKKAALLLQCNANETNMKQECNKDETKLKQDETECNDILDINIEKEEEIDKDIEIDKYEDEEWNIDRVLNNLLKLNLLTEDDIENYPYKDKIFQHSHHLTYGLIQSIAIFVLERIPKHLPRRYKLFDISFDNKVREVLEKHDV